MNRFVVFVLAFGCFACVRVPQASALPEFKKAFEAKYVDKEKNKEFAAVVKKAGCNVCHVKGQKDKSPQNAYGKELNKLVPGDAADRKKEAGDDAAKKEAVKAELLQEIEEAFKQVESMKLPDTEQTYIERIKEGLLPVPLPEK
jgi:hypothetical protein